MRPPEQQRLRPGRSVERRFSSLGGGGAARAQRGLLLRLFGPARRALGGLQVRLSVSGPVEPVARASGAARRPATFRRGRSSRSWKTTTRFRTRCAGERLTQLTSPGRYRAMTALLLLGPGTPMLFHGQEFGATTPYLFFADHHAGAGKAGAQGAEGVSCRSFPASRSEESQAAIDDPAKEETFRRCRLDLTERAENEPIYRLHKDLLRLRREEPALAPRDERWFDGAVLSEQAFLLRYFGDERARRSAAAGQFGHRRADLRPLPEPLLAAPAGMKWAIRWSSEDIAMAGAGRRSWNCTGIGSCWARRPCGSRRRRNRAMDELIRHMPWARSESEREALLTREWLVTNGLGGYASGTVSGVATRRYHGLLIAALPAPLGRMMTLSHLSEKVRLPGGDEVLLGGDELGDGRSEPVRGGLPGRFSAGVRAARLAIRDRRRDDRKADRPAARAEHGVRDLSADRRRRPGAAEAAAQRPFSLARRGGQHAAAAAVHADGRRASGTSCGPMATCRRCGC